MEMQPYFWNTYMYPYPHEIRTIDIQIGIHINDKWIYIILFIVLYHAVYNKVDAAGTDQIWKVSFCAMEMKLRNREAQ